MRKVSQAFYDNVRSSDYVFRYGGDEFIIVLTENSEKRNVYDSYNVFAVGWRNQTEAANGEDIVLSLSIGAAMF
ncbi:diguanylate cyclase [Shigella boydii]